VGVGGKRIINGGQLWAKCKTVSEKKLKQKELGVWLTW
jgi:hypothetical protein